MPPALLTWIKLKK